MAYNLQGMKFLFTQVLLLSIAHGLCAGLPTTIHKKLVWGEPVSLQIAEGEPPVKLLQFEGASYDDRWPGVPLVGESYSLDGYGRVVAFLSSTEVQTVEFKSAVEGFDLAADFQVLVEVARQRRQWVARLLVVPLRKTAAGTYERLVSFTLRLQFEPAPEPVFARGGHTDKSVLIDGQLFKFAVTQTGIYKLDFDFLKSLGVPLESIDPKTIQVFGNGGGMLPEPNSAQRIDDLRENAILVVGEEDGRFDSGDYILMYAEGPSKHQYDPLTQTFTQPIHVYDTRNYYFLKVGVANGLRVQDHPAISNPTYTSTSFNDFIRYEKEERNLLHDWFYGYGSGKQFYGDYFKVTEAKSYSSEFDVTDLDPQGRAYVRASFAGRIQAGHRANITVTVNGQSFTSADIPVTSGSSIAAFANVVRVEGEFTPNTDKLDVELRFNRPTSTFNEGWLDYLEINFRRKLILRADVLRFRDLNSVGHGATEFVLTGARSDTRVWNVTDPQQPTRMLGTLDGATFRFSAATAALQEFVAFNLDGNLPKPEGIGAIPNQNLHGITNADLVILYHPKFEEAATRLAEHRRNFSGLEVALVNIEQLYNEFSSGKKDPVAIRDFARMVYERDPDRFKYLLLFGDGSFDPRDIYKLGGDYIPVWETENSTNPLYSYPSDDFFALLDESEGGNIIVGLLDIAVGRLPVNTAEQAHAMVDKIIHYDTAPQTLRDWRNRIAFVADDEDSNTHINDANKIADALGEKFPYLNIDKIYLDAFEQVSTPGGTRVPLATEAINNNIFKGIAALVYLGHGGIKGWAQERVLKLEDILSWKNFDRLPLIITATCSFAAYDDPAFTSAGELAFLQPQGGAIALFTTTRLVFASSNANLTKASMDSLFTRINGQLPTMGEALRLGKNKVGGENSRKFTLIGDPAQFMAYPQHSIATLRINQRNVDSNGLDTLRALQKVTIEGIVVDENGNLIEGFNGVIYPTVYDKKVTYRTLAQDPGSPPYNFDLQKNIIFKGRASVVNGRFTFSFVVPKDINYAYGKAKLSYYAADESRHVDAAGYYREIVVGGTDPNALTDKQGPRVEVFMNDEHFVFGGLTNPNPTLLVKLSDDNGINVAGNSVGHDLAAVVDQDSKNTYILNDFYEATLDDYTSGEVRYPLYNLSPGRHEVKVTAWDVANNPAEGYTEFLVAEDAKLALDHVLNYPNPFTTSTCFMFEHNMAGSELDVMVQIYTVSGRLIKTIEQRITAEGYRLGLGNCIQWDGRDDFGDRLAKGVYIYKVKVRSTTGDAALEGESDFEKLVILR